jgi:hypothetical protein
MKSSLQLSLIVGLLLFFTVESFASTYTVKKGDTVASIARANYGEPVFGPRGTINKVYKLNPSTKMNAALEPGQKIILEDSKPSKVEAAVAAPVIAVPAAVEPVAVEPVVESPIVDDAIQAAREQAAKIKAALEAEPKITEKKAKSLPLEVPAPPMKENVTLREVREESACHDELPRSYFSVIPSYSLINKAAKDVASGTSYSLNSNLAVSAELGWDHWWTHSFSTVLTYSFTQLSSQETSDLTGSKVISNMLLSEAEFALLNRVATHLRVGLGLTYADHIFIENFTAVPVDPSIYKIAFLSPFAMAEWTAYESERFEGLVNFKAEALPAQVGHGHDLTSGYEFKGQLSLLQKFETWALLYGASYSTENQTRTDSEETSTALSLKVGALF